MKSLLASLSIAVASSSAIAAPNIAEPAAAVAPAATPAPSAEQIALARRFVGLTVTADSYMEATRFGFMSSIVAQLEGIETEKGFDEAETKVGKVFDKIEPKLRERLPNLLRPMPRPTRRNFPPMNYANWSRSPHRLQANTICRATNSSKRTRQS